MKRKYREAMRAKRRLVEQVDDEEEAVEVRDWHEEWTQSQETSEAKQQYESQ